MKVVRAALTETINVYGKMPETVERLGDLKGSLEEIRRANVDHHLALMEEASRQGVQAICFGELFPGPYFALTIDPMWLEMAETVAEGPTVRELRDAARRLSMIVVAPIYEYDREVDRRFNTAVIIDERGEVIGKFRKSHIPHGANEKGSFLEGFYYDRSDGRNGTWPANVSDNPFFPVYKTSLANIGVAICYDRHFAGVMWTLARGGAQLVFSPAVTFGAKSERMWPLEFAVDAARHNLFIGGSNRRGKEAPWNQEFFGRSHFVGPNGELTNLSTHPELVISDVDLAELEAPDPSGWNLLRDVRHDVVMRAH
jgi:N-carbamoylputrescine amidase